MPKWVQAVKLEELKPAQKFVHRRKEIAIFKLEDGVYAIDNSCSHEYSPLYEGLITPDAQVCCPKHGSRFDIRTGAVKDFPATRPVSTYPVKIEDGYVWINI